MSASKSNVTKVIPGPCAAEAEASRLCNERTGGVKSKCLDVFARYRDCKSAAYEKKRQERSDVFWGKEQGKPEEPK
jgi:hypothetical protein